MMRSDKINWYGHGGYKEMTAQSSNIVVTNESESKRSIVNKTLSQKYSANILIGKAPKFFLVTLVQ